MDFNLIFDLKSPSFLRQDVRRWFCHDEEQSMISYFSSFQSFVNYENSSFFGILYERLNEITSRLKSNNRGQPVH